MGRIKTALIKRATFKLIDMHKEQFSKEFSKNKELVSKFAIIKSKKLRNVISGYVSRQIKNKDKPVRPRVSVEDY